MPSGYYERKPRDLYPLNCICGTIFYVNKSRKDKAKFCSKKCVDYNKAPMPQMRKNSTRVCVMCHKEFLIPTWRLKDPSRGKFCGPECSLHRRDSLAANWQGGINGLILKKRLNHQYVGLKRNLIKSVPWCIQCGSIDRLVMDHIIPIAINPDGIYDKDNVQLLCTPCHKLKTREDMKEIYAMKRKRLQNV